MEIDRKIAGFDLFYQILVMAFSERRKRRGRKRKKVG